MLSCVNTWFNLYITGNLFELISKLLNTRDCLNPKPNLGLNIALYDSQLTLKSISTNEENSSQFRIDFIKTQIFIVPFWK